MKQRRQNTCHILVITSYPWLRAAAARHPTSPQVAVFAMLAAWKEAAAARWMPEPELRRALQLMPVPEQKPHPSTNRSRIRVPHASARKQARWSPVLRRAEWGRLVLPPQEPLTVFVPSPACGFAP
jgi:hypothetical protein